ncbi:MFS transporter [Bdellovibrio sp. qaytius]|nr:MFS transporter [Bdellovibrio sp. qaytius]
MKKPLIVIFFTVFIYLLGFGMIIPVLPLLSTHYGASAWEAGLLMSSYSLMQFIFAPFWGKLSDRYGRRPILMYCLLGEVISYLVLATSRSLEMLFVARIMTGFFGASISTASAYVSDVTTPENRSKGMALIGAAFGLGFLFGPAIGGGLTVFAEKISTDMGFIASFSSYGVAVLCLFTFIFAYFNLTESISAETRAKNSEIKRHRFAHLTRYFKMPVVSPLITSFALTTISMAMMEATLVLFMKERYNWSIKEVSFGFAYIGIIIVFTQGYLVRKLIPRFGEKNLLRVGLFSMALGFTGIGLVSSIPMMGVVMTFVSLGSGLTNPSILGSISLLVPPDEQGVALGTTQSLSALGRVIGPAVGGFLFQSAAINSPFILAGGLTFFALSIIYIIFKSLPEHGRTVKV